MGRWMDVGIPEEVALGVQPGRVEPCRLAQLLQLAVVDGHVGVAIVIDRSVNIVH